MGKQPRRRNKRRNKNNTNNQLKKPDTLQNSPNDDPSSSQNAASSSSSSSSSSLVSSQPHGLVTARIRHGDPRVRSGALSALSCTLFSPEALRSSKQMSHETTKTKLLKTTTTTTTTATKNNGNEISVPLLKAISEKVLDEDGSVAKNAAGCWNNFILFANSEDLKKLNDIDIGAILNTRIQTCCRKILEGLDKIDSFDSSVTLNEPSSTTSPASPKTVAGAAAGAASKDVSMSKKQTTKSNDNKKKKKGSNVKQQVSFVTAQLDIANICLQTLCALIESIPEAVEKFTSKLLNLDPKSIQNQFSPLPITHILIQMLLLGNRAFTSPSTSNLVQSSGPTVELMGDCMTWASRTLHAILDENVPLAKCFLSETAAAPQPQNNSLLILSSIIQGGSFPSKTRLHCSGIIITLRNIVSGEANATIPSSSSSSSLSSPLFLNELTKLCIEVVLPLLLQYLEYRQDIATALAQRVATTLDALEEEKQDEYMEKKIIQQVKEKKEPARQIARRQKEAKKKKKAEEELEEQKMKDIEMVKGEQHDSNIQADDTGKKEEQDVSASTSSSKKKKKGVGRKNAEEDYENAVKAWETASTPLKLALEVATNFCGGSHTNTFSKSQDEESNDDDVMMYDSDVNEEALLNEETSDENNTPATLMNPLDGPVLEAIVKANLPEHVVSLLIAISSPMQILHKPHNTTKAQFQQASNSHTVPKVVRLDIAQIKSKCGSCLGNIVSTLPLDGANVETAFIKIWESLRGGISISSTSYDKEEDFLVGTADLINAMSSLMRSHPQIATLERMNPRLEINFLLQLLQSFDKEIATERNAFTPMNIESIEDISQNTIFLLGSFCTQMKDTESMPAIAEVSKTFLKIISQSSVAVSLQNEILNVLMDIFGDDDNSGINELFDSLDMMNVFKKAIPLFKKNINKVKNTNEISEKEILLWRETALNGRRFIDYKLDQMEL